MTDKAPEFIWAIDKVDLRQYVHRDTHQALEAENNRLREALKEIDEGSVDISEAAMVARAALETEK